MPICWRSVSLSRARQNPFFIQCKPDCIYFQVRIYYTELFFKKIYFFICTLKIISYIENRVRVIITHVGGIGLPLGYYAPDFFYLTFSFYIVILLSGLDSRAERSAAPSVFSVGYEELAALVSSPSDNPLVIQPSRLLFLGCAIFSYRGDLFVFFQRKLFFIICIFIFQRFNRIKTQGERLVRWLYISCKYSCVYRVPPYRISDGAGKVVVGFRFAICIIV